MAWKSTPPVYLRAESVFEPVGGIFTVIRASHLTRRTIAVLVAIVMLAIPAVPALADEVLPPAPPIISTGVTVCGVDVGGMTAEEASAAVRAGWSLPALPPLTLDVTGTLFPFDPAPVVTLDMDALLGEAFAAAAPVDLAPRYSIDTTAVTAFVAAVDASITVKAVGSKRVIVKRRLKITKSRNGLRLNRAATETSLTAAITAELAAGGAQQPPVAATVIVKKPRYTRSNIGKTILVVLRERYLYYYKNTKLVKKYRCAIGMPGHATPRGTFKVIAKNPHPAWRNPGSAWARTMPGYIAPGFYNPLGLRALYINSPGIRIHGTAKTWSMGQAASHGCVRLTNANIVKLYPLIPVGTPVIIVK